MGQPLKAYMLSFTLAKYPGMKQLNHMVDVCFIFKEAAELFSKMVVSYYISTSSVGKLQLIHLLTRVH